MKLFIFSLIIGAVYGRLGPPLVRTTPRERRLEAARDAINSLRSQRPNYTNLIDEDFMFVPIWGEALNKQEFLDQVVLSGRFDPGQPLSIRENQGNVFLEFRSVDKITFFFVDCRNWRQPLIVNGFERRVPIR